MDLLAQGRITQNLIELSCELGFGSDHDNNLKSRRKNRRAAPSKGLKLHFQHQKESSRTKVGELGAQAGAEDKNGHAIIAAFVL
jgi:hypothetical protein